MSDLFTPLALLPHGWARDVRITIDETGTIAHVRPNAERRDATELGGPVLPGMPNLHSRAFARALTGRAEGMNELVGLIEPDDLEAIATQTYAEMLEAGYT